MLFRINENTVGEINKNSFITDKEYYKYLMNIEISKSPKFLNIKNEQKKVVTNVVNNDSNFIKKFL